MSDPVPSLIGESANDGHNFLYTDVAQWEQDVFAFLDGNVRP
jgi:hypothetical protein